MARIVLAKLGSDAHDLGELRLDEAFVHPRDPAPGRDFSF